MRSPSVNALFFVSVFAIGVIIVFLSVSQYSRKETVQGFLSPTDGVVKVSAPRPGTITRLHVDEGDTVQAGQPLLSIVNERVTANGQDVDARVRGALRQQRDLLSEQISNQPRREGADLARLQASIAGLEQQIVHLQGQVGAQEQRIVLLKGLESAEVTLVKKGYVAASAHAARQEAVLEQELSSSALREQLAARRRELGQERLALEQLPDTFAEQTRDLRARLLEVEQRLAQADGDRAYVVRAPVAGTVSTLQAFVGRTVDPQQLQVALLPEGSKLQAQLYVPTRAAGFVRPGQKVRLLYDAFPYQRFGAQHGHILSVSRTILTEADGATPFRLEEPAYKVTVGLDAQSIDVYGEPVPLQAGMLLSADIILDRSSIIAWVLDPLLSAGRRL